MARNSKPFRLRQLRPKGPTLTAQYDPESVKESGGVGGWTEIARPRRSTATEWVGEPARRLTFTLFFDRWEDDRSIEQSIRLLRAMGKRNGRKRPPRLAVDYGPVGRGSLWVIDALEFGDELRNDEHERVRQEVTVTLLAYVDDEVNLSPAERHRRKRKDRDEDEPRAKSVSDSVYTVKRGDTLSSIAARLLGDVARWTEIGELNDIRDPLDVTAGQLVKMPQA